MKLTSLTRLYTVILGVSLVTITGCGVIGESGQEPYLEDVSSSVSFSKESGAYSGAITVSLESSNSDDTIYYTLDGSAPTLTGYSFSSNGGTVSYPTANKYIAPITITSTTMIRARVYKNEVAGPDTYATYFINEPTILPIVSLAIDPLHLYDDLVGIYVSGNNTTNPVDSNENFYQKWERPVHISYFDTSKVHQFSMHAGVRIFGRHSRVSAQKSLAIFARSDYGQDRIPNYFFETKNNKNQSITTLPAIVLRNSGDDWDRSMFRDGLLHELAAGLDIEKQAYQPSIVFINGQYWGIHNIREKINERYIANHYDYVDPANINIIARYDSRIVEGTNSDMIALVTFVKANDMSTTANYNYIKSQIDINNFIDYAAMQIYVNNTDWPFANIKAWKPGGDNQKWRWILYDLDGSFAGKEWAGAINDFNHNTISFVLAESTDLHFGALFSHLFNSNLTFKAEFIARLRAIASTQFLPATVHSKITELNALISTEITRHNTRWPSSGWRYGSSVTVLRDFATNRASYLETMIGLYE